MNGRKENSCTNSSMSSVQYYQTVSRNGRSLCLFPHFSLQLYAQCAHLSIPPQDYLHFCVLSRLVFAVRVQLHHCTVRRVIFCHSRTLFSTFTSFRQFALLPLYIPCSFFPLCLTSKIRHCCTNSFGLQTAREKKAAIKGIYVGEKWLR